MMAVFLQLLTWRRSSERHGHMVLTFQLASCKIDDFFFLLSLSGADLQPACRFCLSSKHPMEQAGCGESTPFWLGAAQLEEGGS